MYNPNNSNAPKYVNVRDKNDIYRSITIQI